MQLVGNKLLNAYRLQLLLQIEQLQLYGESYGDLYFLAKQLRLVR